MLQGAELEDFPVLASHRFQQAADLGLQELVAPQPLGELSQPLLALLNAKPGCLLLRPEASCQSMALDRRSAVAI